MSTQDLIPQGFPDNAVTLLPAIDFVAYAAQRLPKIYQDSPSFMGIVNSIAILKQEIYDLLRSLCNVYNIYSSRSSDSAAAVPKGIYLRMLASDLNAPFNNSDDDSTVFTSIVKRINSVVSRGSPLSFYNYFQQNNLSGLFNNLTVQEINNATIFFDVPIPNTPLVTPNPYTVFYQDMAKLKGAGIKIEINSTINIPFFQLADLDGNVAPENAGFAGLNEFGQPLAGGFYKSL